MKKNFFERSEEINMNNKLEYFIDLYDTYSVQNEKNDINLHQNNIIDERYPRTPPT